MAEPEPEAESEGCVFCAIVSGQADATVLFESADHICTLDAYPVSEGHVLVLPKAHVELSDTVATEGLFEFL